MVNVIVTRALGPATMYDNWKANLHSSQRLWDYRCIRPPRFHRRPVVVATLVPLAGNTVLAFVAHTQCAKFVRPEPKISKIFFNYINILFLLRNLVFF